MILEFFKSRRYTTGPRLIVESHRRYGIGISYRTCYGLGSNTCFRWEDTYKPTTEVWDELVVETWVRTFYVTLLIRTFEIRWYTRKIWGD